MPGNGIRDTLRLRHAPAGGARGHEVHEIDAGDQEDEDGDSEEDAHDTQCAAIAIGRGQMDG